jgi:phosphoglycerol transferase MdoB-like AlkP superfamily enzyme
MEQIEQTEQTERMNGAFQLGKPKPARLTLKKGPLGSVGFAEILWLYTLPALFIKSILLVGLTLDQMHATILFKEAWRTAGQNFAFYCGSVALPLSFAFLFRKRTRLWYLVVLNVLVSVLFCADIWYFRGFNTMPTLVVLKESPNLNNLTDSILGMMRIADIAFVADLLLLIPLAAVLARTCSRPRRRILPFCITLAVALGFLGFIPLKLYLSGANVKNRIVYMYDSTVTSRNLSPLGYHFYSVYTFFNEGKTVALSAAERAEIAQWYAEKEEELPDNKYKGMFAGKNLIVLQVESLEKFVINRNIEGQEITPNLNRLLGNSIYFSDVHEQVHEGNTIDAEFLANASLYPLKQGSTSFLYPSNTYVNTLPKIMARQGYHTLDIQPDPGSFWNWMILMRSLGFQECIDNTAFHADESFGMGISDASFLRQVEPVLAKQKEPFHAFVLTESSHTPFNLPQSLRELKLPEELDETYLGGYFQSIHYADKQIGIFLDSLKKDGVLDNSLVVLYGDHEGIHKYFPDSLAEIDLEGDWWKDNHKQTPLILYHPGLKGEEITTTGGEIDILPTVCYVMGIDSSEYKGTAMGRNLLNTNQSFAVLQGRKYVGAGGDPAVELHAVKGLDIADRILRGNYFKKGTGSK